MYMGLINHMSHVKHNTWTLRTTGIYLAYYAYIGGPTLLQSCTDRHHKAETSASVCNRGVSVSTLLMIDRSVYPLSLVVKCTDLVPRGDSLRHILEITWNYIVLYCILCSFDSKQITSSYLPFFTEKITPNKIWNIVQCYHCLIHTQFVRFWQTTLSLRMNNSWIWAQKGEHIKQ